MIDESFSKTIVEGIQHGLKMAEIAKRENADKFDNAERFRIIDKMMSSLYYKIGEDKSFEVKEFYRYGYKLLLAYNRETHTLYSFMSEDRLATLINSDNSDDKQNYIFSLIKFNPDDRQQMFLSEMDATSVEQDKIQERIREIIEEDGQIQYVTVLYKKQGYRLLRVRAVKLSQYAEVIESKDLSDYITVDYEDIYASTDENKEEFVADLDFNFKPNVLSESENLDVKLDKDNNDRGISNE